MNNTHLLVRIVSACCLVVTSATYADQPQQPSQSIADEKNLAGAFVQDFYDWYAPMAYRQKNSLPWENAVTLKSALFSTKLAVVLHRDQINFAKPDGTYAELEVDPFLNTDNPCEHYVIGEVLEYDKSFRVGMQAICNGKLRPKIVVQAEVIRKKDHWLFMNFYYPEGKSIFEMLKALRKKRSNDLE
jgi:hypothetical protein